MEDDMNNIKAKIKSVMKKIPRKGLIIFLPAIIILILLAGAIYVYTIDDGSYKEGDESNVPYMFSKFSNDINISDEGEITTSMTAQELWDELIKNDSRINLYLEDAKQLKKMMNADLCTDFLDTREDPTEEIDWDELNKDPEENLVQGIIKLKRQFEDGETTEIMTYVSPDEFRSYIEEYNETGSEEAKMNALTHFTLVKNTSTSSGATAGIITGSGNFTKYSLTEAQLEALAYLCYREQGSLKGAAAEASLMANLFEIKGSSFGTGADGLYNYVRNSGWFANSESYMDNPDVSQEYIEVVRAVLVNGKRTLPGYIDEHDWIYDLSSATNNGSSIDIEDRSAYQANVTELKNIYGAIYTFYSFPAEDSDPFGYTSEEYRQQVGDAYYDFDTGLLVNGSSTGTTGSTTGSTSGNTTSGSTTGTNSGTSGSSSSLGTWHWPTDGTDITSTFGYRPGTIINGADLSDHTGLDIAIPTGTNIYACDNGTVTFAGWNDGGYGYLVTIDHGNGYVSMYAHNSEVLVSEGDVVTKGQVVALSGSTGYSTGPHVHFQIEYEGEPVDPLTFKYDNGLGDGTATGSSSTVTGAGAGAATTTFYALVASWSETTNSVESNDPDQETYSNTTYKMTTTNLNYQALVKNYTMPFDYLWQHLVIGEDIDLVMDLADLVFGSDIEITIFDNLTTTTNVRVENYTELEKVESTATATFVYKDAEGNVKTITKSGAWTDVAEFPYETIYTTITKTNTMEIAVTLADVWMAKYTKEYTYEIPDDVVTETYNEFEDIPYPDTPDIENGPNIYGHSNELWQQIYAEATGYESTVSSSTTNQSDYYYATVDRSETITNTVSKTKYVASPLVVEEKTDKDAEEPNYVTVFIDPLNSKGKNSILSAESWFFELIETNPNTVHLLDLTKYLLYKATGKSYGVTEFDFSVFDAGSFNTVQVTGINLLREYIRKWENSSTPPTNADGTKYIIEDDGVGHPTVGYGVDIENSGYKDKFIAAGYPTTIGGEVPIEFVDAIEEEIITNYLEQVKAKTASLNLTEYQINALVSRAYNCGVAGALDTERGSPSMNFVSSYNAYWNQERDDQFEEKNNNANFSHSLYTQYMSLPVTSEGQYLLGLERRRKSEWTLFQTGYYDVLDKWHSAGGSGNILQAAAEVHEAERSWTYSDGDGLTFNDIEKALNNPYQVTCCATFVSCVLYRAGYFTAEELNEYNYNYVPDLNVLLSSAGWQRINSYDELQPGDIVITGDEAHIQIYAGDDSWYNAGSTKAIQLPSTDYQGPGTRSSFSHGFRPQ